MTNPEEYLEVFEPFEKLVSIEILGEEFNVPENNTLLRCFQYLSMETVSMGDFCWNGDCANCQVWLAEKSMEKPVLACRTKVKEEMKIVRVSSEIELNKK
jgi:NADH dehydrogenase/NADH:ubiquinone oxidoreductase subunit G